MRVAVNASSSNDGDNNDEIPLDEEEPLTLEPLEIDFGDGDGDEFSVDGNGEPTEARRGEAPWIALLRYCINATIAVSLAYLVPNTKLRTNNAYGKDATMDTERLAELVVVAVLTLGSLWAVHGSNPGYLTPDIVSSVCEDDGLTLLGYEHDQEQQPQDVTMDQSLQQAEEAPTVIPGRSDTITQRRSATKTSNSQRQQEEQDACFRGTRRKVCAKCGFAPPLRSHHCRICNKCVATFDHHCNFIGTCIGERNHCRFLVFLVCQMLGFWVCTSIVASSHNSNFTWQTWVLVLLAKVYLYPLTFVATMMCVVHTGFAFLNMTTFECGKGPRHIDYLRGTRTTDFVFSRGFHYNLFVFCCQRDAACMWMTGEAQWKPILWQTPGKIVRDSEDWWEHPWQNKYWSCC